MVTKYQTPEKFLKVFFFYFPKLLLMFVDVKCTSKTDYSHECETLIVTTFFKMVLKPLLDREGLLVTAFFPFRLRLFE